MSQSGFCGPDCHLRWWTRRRPTGTRPAPVSWPPRSSSVAACRPGRAPPVRWSGTRAPSGTRAVPAGGADAPPTGSWASAAAAAPGPAGRPSQVTASSSGRVVVLHRVSTGRLVPELGLCYRGHSSLGNLENVCFQGEETWL